jgi:diaminopimelate epimerase
VPAESPALTLLKAHAYGNDFLLAVGVEPAGVSDLADVARRVCDRHQGVGADGLLFVTETTSGARMHLRNADGSPSELSGNGVRCVGAWLAWVRALADGSQLAIETDAGPKHLTLVGHGARRFTFRADMGLPEDLRRVELSVGADTVTAVTMRIGNPQCVVLGAATDARLHQIASRLAVHPHFTHGTNVELADVITPELVRILIWERGVGPTMSSGTGTCAAAVAAAAYGGASRAVDVAAPGGTQSVSWTETGLTLTGWAELVGRVEWWR